MDEFPLSMDRVDIDGSRLSLMEIYIYPWMRASTNSSPDQSMTDLVYG